MLQLALASCPSFAHRLSRLACQFQPSRREQVFAVEARKEAAGTETRREGKLQYEARRAEEETQR
ncbi:hypothetical protein C8T65DRAFT_648991, partial [Cerioporus squamosus]